MSRDRDKRASEAIETVEGGVTGGVAGGAAGVGVGAVVGAGVIGAAGIGVGMAAGGVIGAGAGVSAGLDYVEKNRAEDEAEAAEAEAAIMEEAQDIRAQGGVSGPEAIAQARENQR